MNATRLFLWAVGIPLVFLQAWFVAGPDGVIDRYGLLGAFPAFFRLSFEDPLLSAGVVDFVVLFAVATLWMIRELPAKERWTLATFAWLVINISVPGIGIVLYFLWLNRQHRFVSEA